MAAVKRSFPESGKSSAHGHLEKWQSILKLGLVSGRIYCSIIYDVTLKIIRNYAVTAASIYDKNVFLELLDQENTNKKVYADSAYRTKDHEAELIEKGFRPMLQRKGCKNKPLSTNEKKGNHTRAKVRCRIEHMFGIRLQRAGCLVLRTIGIARAKTKIGLRNFSYNLDRYCTLRKAMA